MNTNKLEWIDTKKNFLIKCIEQIFTELKKSEDEIIRKKLITFFQRFPYTNLYDANLNVKDVLAWLEKQGEQKPINFKASNWYVSKVDGKIHDMTYNPADKVK